MRRADWQQPRFACHLPAAHATRWASRRGRCVVDSAGLLRTCEVMGDSTTFSPSVREQSCRAGYEHRDRGMAARRQRPAAGRAAPRRGSRGKYFIGGKIAQQFRQGLRDAGYVEGRDLVIEWRYRGCLLLYSSSDTYQTGFAGPATSDIRGGAIHQRRRTDVLWN